MKILFLLTLATLAQAQAAVEFGGFNFHSSVTASQADSLKSDIKYLYQNPISKPDAEFATISEMGSPDGLHMHNWLINRIRFILGESFKIDDTSMIGARYTFPKTPLPAMPADPTAGGPASPLNPTPVKNPEVKTVMTNIGGALYIGGKQEKIAFGIKFDGTNVLMTSPRVGLLQVGEGLFLKRFLLNPEMKAPANAIFRLSTLFHEARHSDGNGLHTGFLHEFCPIGHPYAGYGACEISGNGSYTIGALSERHLLNNCGACSTAEKSALQASVVDSFSRIISPPASVRLSSLKRLARNYSAIIDLYKEKKNLAMTTEVQKLNDQVKMINLEMLDIMETQGKAPMYDSKPEGEYVKVSLDESKRLMTKALK